MTWINCTNLIVFIDGYKQNIAYLLLSSLFCYWVQNWINPNSQPMRHSSLAHTQCSYFFYLFAYLLLIMYYVLVNPPHNTKVTMPRQSILNPILIILLVSFFGGRMEAELYSSWLGNPGLFSIQFYLIYI